MPKIDIDEATNEQLDYAVAVAQGFKKGFSQTLQKNVWLGKTKLGNQWLDVYAPTTNQAQCFDLILKFKVSCTWNQESGDSSRPDYLNQWYCTVQDSVFYDYNESLNIAVVKAVLLSVYRDEMIEIESC